MRSPFVKLCVVISFALASAIALRSSANEPKKSTEAQIKWQANIHAAHDIAVDTGKPMLILVTGEACPPCKKLKSTTLTDPRVVKYVNSLFVPVQLDFEKDSKVIEILEVEQIPSTIVLSPDADLLGRFVGYAAADDYHEALEKSRRIQKKIESLRQASADKEHK